MTSAIILAGGLGTRLRSAVPELPKSMAPIAGRPFLAHQMDHWIGEGVDHFVLAVGYRGEVITRFFGTCYRGAKLDYSIETTALGTGGALLLASSVLSRKEPALLLNGDTYFDVSLTSLAAPLRRDHAAWCFALFRSEDTARFMGVELDASGRIIALRKAGSPLANGGVYWFQPSALTGFTRAAGQTLSLEDDRFPRMLSRGQTLIGIECGGAFIDIGVPQDYWRADALLPSADVASQVDKRWPDSSVAAPKSRSRTSSID